MSVKTFKEGIKLDPQSADPTATEGQVQFADGSVRNKGLWQYKDGAWSAIGGGAGDADTIHLIKANDSQASDFTIKSIDDIMPDPEGSDTLAGTFSIPTTGSEALLSNDDDHKVFKFASAASSQYDAFGITKSIPRYIRGEDVVLQFKYRTADTSGDSADADYMIWAWDKTNGQNETTTSSGSVSAGTAITIGSSTGMAVGDKIWVGETGGTSQVTEAHITEITSGTQIKISETVNLTSGDRFVTGILTDVLTTLDAADDDTNKTGNDFKVVFNVPDTCAEVTLLFQQLTSQTDSFLYVDNILISSEVVKRVFAKEQSEYFNAYTIAGFGSTNTYCPYFTNINEDTLSKELSYVNDSTNGLVFTALRKCKVDISVAGSIIASSSWLSIVKNGVLNAGGASASNDGKRLAVERQDQADNPINISSSVVLNKGDTLAMLFEHTSGATTYDYAGNIQVVATPEVNDVVVVESTDSVISEWTSFSPTITGFGTTSAEAFHWRRVGQDMEIHGTFQSGTPTASTATITMPSGYLIASTLGRADTNSIGTYYRENTGGVTSHGGSVFSDYNTDNSLIYFGNQNTFGSGSIDPMAPAAGNSVLATSGEVMSFNAKVPIAGWDANPKPLLSFPTITYGQDAQAAEAIRQSGFWDATGDTNDFDISLVSNNDNDLFIIEDDAVTTNATRIRAKRRIRLSATAAGTTNAASNVMVYKNNTLHHQIAQAGGGYSTPIHYEGILDPGEYIHFRVDNASATNGSISILATPEEGQVNQAAIIAQPVAFVEDQKGATTAPGTFTSGSWVTRDLNTLGGDIAAVGVTLSSNQFTLPAGKFLIEWEAPACDVDQHQSRLYNHTNSSVEKWGTNGFAESTTPQSSQLSKGKKVITTTSSSTFSIEHRCETTSSGTYGLGGYNSIDFGEDYVVFANVKITRLK